MGNTSVYKYLRTYPGTYEMDSDQIEQSNEEYFYPESELPIFEKIWGKGFVSAGRPDGSSGDIAGC